MTIPANTFIFVNVLIALIYIVFIYNSYKNGMMFEGISLFYTVIALGVSYFVAPIMARRFVLFEIEDVLYELFDIGYYLQLIIWFVIVFLILKLVYFLIAPLLKSISKVPLIGFVNRLGGCVFGFFNATIVVLLLSLLTLTPAIKNGHEVRENTAFTYVSEFTSKVTSYIAEKIGDNAKDELGNIDIDKTREEFEHWLVDQGVFDE